MNARFIWDHANQIIEKNAAGSTLGTYTYNPLLYGNLISQKRGANSHFYMFDALGSTLWLASSSATVANSYLYKAYGAIVAQTGAVFSPYKWLGKVGYNDEAGMHFVRARNYDRITARWMSKDPIGFSGGWNLYEYVGGRPTNFVDPSGLRPCTPAERAEGMSTCEARCAASKLVWNGKILRCESTDTPKGVLVYVACDCREEPKNCGKCTPQELAYLQAAKDLACIGAAKPRPGMACDTLLELMRKNTACAATRQAIQNRCFPGKTDPIHQKLIDEHTQAAKDAWKYYTGRACPPPLA